jgi:pimeloyl-ACP methyl ester carboxylesterase
LVSSRRSPCDDEKQTKHIVPEQCLSLLLKQIGWLDGKQFILLGHSLGAGVLTWTEAWFPKHVRCMVTIDSLGPPEALKGFNFANHHQRALRVIINAAIAAFENLRFNSRLEAAQAKR